MYIFGHAMPEAVPYFTLFGHVPEYRVQEHSFGAQVLGKLCTGLYSLPGCVLLEFHGFHVPFLWFTYHCLGSMCHYLGSFTHSQVSLHTGEREVWGKGVHSSECCFPAKMTNNSHIQSTCATPGEEFPTPDHPPERLLMGGGGEGRPGKAQG